MKTGVLSELRTALYEGDMGRVATAVRDGFAPEAVARFCFPFEDQSRDDLLEAVWGPLFEAWPDAERRETIVIEGRDADGADWIGCGGSYIGTFAHPWLDIPPTQRLCHMRFHEFFRIVDGQVVEVQALWDIPEVMMQARAWPMAPSLGRNWHVPGPATQDGFGPHDLDQSERSRTHVIDMLTDLSRHPSEGGPEVMQLPKYWHPKMNWYGPAGIGTARGVDGFRKLHQIPFLNAMPDRGQYPDEVSFHFIAQGNYVGVTGWPDMVQTLSDGGWLGIAPAGCKISMRSLDFWRLEDGLIRENWVLVDLLHVYDQLGVDVFARMRELTGAGN